MTAVAQANLDDAREELERASLTLTLQLLVVAPFLAFALWKWGWIALGALVVGVAVLGTSLGSRRRARERLRELEEAHGSPGRRLHDPRQDG